MYYHSDVVEMEVREAKHKRKSPTASGCCTTQLADSERGGRCAGPEPRQQVPPLALPDNAHTALPMPPLRCCLGCSLCHLFTWRRPQRASSNDCLQGLLTHSTGACQDTKCRFPERRCQATRLRELLAAGRSTLPALCLGEWDGWGWVW